MSGLSDEDIKTIIKVFLDTEKPIKQSSRLWIDDEAYKELIKQSEVE